ncbi:hypothetical protein ABIA39_003967 [Nocardia sp. GAS34]|uniref:ESX secretion-associated protein EspG n=1 Tax=unclassified Nocardia TaxID=2637762 RepID=UPI003D1EEADD
MKWEFTPDEFMHIWNETGLDRYPFPLRLISSVQWQNEYAKMAEELRARLPRDGDVDLSAALRVAASPEVSAALIGKRRNRMRVYGAIDTNVGVTLFQRPGPTDEFGGNVVVEIGSPTLIPNVFAVVVGSVPAGRGPKLVESIDRIEVSLESWTGTKVTTAERMRNLLTTRRVGWGHIEVQAALRDRRPLPAQYMSWIDVDGDGCYGYREQYNDFHVEPLSRETVAREVARMANEWRE